MTETTISSTALQHTAFLAIEGRHTKEDDRDVQLCIRQGLAKWLPGAMPGWLRVGLTKSGEEAYLNLTVDGDWAE